MLACYLENQNISSSSKSKNGTDLNKHIALRRKAIHHFNYFFPSAERLPITTNILITTQDGVGAAPYRVLLLSASVLPSVGRLCSHRQLVTIIVYTIVCTHRALARSFPLLHVSINIQFHMTLFSILHMCLANVLSFVLFTPLPCTSGRNME